MNLWRTFFGVLFAIVLTSGIGWTQSPPDIKTPDAESEGSGIRNHEPSFGSPQGLSPFSGKPAKGFKDPADKAKREKMLSVRSMAEAYKNLSELYREQGKIEDSVAQLKKIIDLANSPEGKEDPMIGNQMGRVYMEIAEIYAEKNRWSEAEVFLNDAIEKTKSSDSELCSRLGLFLGKVLKKAGKTAEAEKAFQKVVEMNAGRISEKK